MYIADREGQHRNFLVVVVVHGVINVAGKEADGQK